MASTQFTYDTPGHHFTRIRSGCEAEELLVALVVDDTVSNFFIARWDGGGYVNRTKVKD